MNDGASESQSALLARIAAALERLAPPPPSAAIAEGSEGYLWLAREQRLQPVAAIARVDLGLLKRIEAQREVLLANTRNFAAGRPANNALLWGPRGTGKSALVKAVHAAVNAECRTGSAPLALVEVQRADVGTLGRLLPLLQAQPSRRFVIFCDDLSFEAGEAEYKSLKAVLDGGIAGRPQNVLIYATSNRRHLMPRDMIENERATAINPGEAVEEKVSLSDRFGLWLGFHNIDQDGYLEMIDGYAAWYGIGAPREQLHHAALQWALQRGSRSGRTAWQFIQDWLGGSGGLGDR
ncbi:MAG: ATP-binding protein [Proteobacteria bacterium]|nr:ATP-binding protein [Pseudomonadota bacterium]